MRYAPIGTVELVECTSCSVSLRATAVRIEVAALASDLFRVGVFAGGVPPRYVSVAVEKCEWPTTECDIFRGDSEILMRGAATVRLDPLCIGFEDVYGRSLARDDRELRMGFTSLDTERTLVDALSAAPRVYKQHLPGTHYFGCGERTGGLDKTDSHQVFWNIDPPSGHTASLNNLYTSVPFVLALRGPQAWGVFVNSSYRIEFDLVREHIDRCSFAVDGGPLIYYVMCGPTPGDVLERYTELTGRIPMPPRLALGNHHSRWGHNTAERLLEVVRTFRARALPLDVVYLDIDYMDGFRVFTWNRTAFPEPAALRSRLDEMGVKLVTILDPGVKVDEGYSVYTSGREQDLFCKTLGGEEYRNVVWTGLCAFPDFTNPRTRAWWSGLHRKLLDEGVDGIWCDMNEPTVLVDWRLVLVGAPADEHAAITQPWSVRLRLGWSRRRRIRWRCNWRVVGEMDRIRHLPTLL